MSPEELFFFHEHPAALPLYERFAERVREMVPEAEIRVGKSQISFRNRHNFAFVSFLPARRRKDRPETYLTVSFGLDRRVESPRIDQASEPYPNRWTHHVLVGMPEELDEELMGWVRAAAAFSAAK